MKRTILLVATTTRWLGTARMPRVLADAGFEVALLAPVGSLAEMSRYVARIERVPRQSTPMQWLDALVRLVEAAGPQLIVPGDEMAVRLLFELVLDPPPALPPSIRAYLRALLSVSLGDPRFYLASIDKTLLPAAAEALGVRVPGYGVATAVDEAVAIAEGLGYPVFLKRRFGFAGQGMAVVSTPAELIQAARRLLLPDQLDLGASLAPRLLVQALVAGEHHSQAIVALRGVPLAGFAWVRDESTSPIKGQTTVLRFVNSPQTRTMSDALCRGFGLCGFFNVQFIVEARTGLAHLLEINRRIVTHTHLGERVGCDLGRALHDGLDDRPVERARPDGAAGGSVVIFPREWLRDPESPALSRYPVDAPWDDPAVLEAMLGMRHEE